MLFARLDLFPFCYIFVMIIRNGNACMNPGDSTDGSKTDATEKPGASTTPSNTESPTTPTNNLDAQCKALAADFGNGNTGSYEGNKWALQKNGKLFGNQDTGLTKGAPGKQQYMGVELSPGDSYTLSSAPVSFSENKNLLVKYYEATDKIVLKACTNDESNCKDISNPGIAREDKNPGWKTVNYPLTSDTRKILFVAKNSGNNFGVVALDSIGISDSPDGPNKCSSS